MYEWPEETQAMNRHGIICSEKTHIYFNSIPLILACTARPGLPLSPPEIAFLESPYYRPQTASTTTSIADRHHPTNFHSVTYTQNDDAAFEAGSDNDHKSFLRMRVIFKVEYPTFFRVSTCFNGSAAAMDAQLGFGTRLRWFCDRGVW